MSAGRPRLLTDAEVIRLRNLVRGGTTVRAAAQLLDVAKSTASRRLRQNYKQPERPSL